MEKALAKNEAVKGKIDAFKVSRKNCCEIIMCRLYSVSFATGKVIFFHCIIFLRSVSLTK